MVKTLLTLIFISNIALAGASEAFHFALDVDTSDKTFLDTDTTDDTSVDLFLTRLNIYNISQKTSSSQLYTRPHLPNSKHILEHSLRPRAPPFV